MWNDLSLGATSFFCDLYYHNIRFDNKVIFFLLPMPHDSFRFPPSEPSPLRDGDTTLQEFNSKGHSGSWWNCQFNNLVLHISWTIVVICVYFYLEKNKKITCKTQYLLKILSICHSLWTFTWPNYLYLKFQWSSEPYCLCIWAGSQNTPRDILINPFHITKRPTDN